MQCSILSYPDRGKWGDAKWRGNCSGYIYKDIFDITIPDYKREVRSFVDPMQGSGTSIEVARELGIEAYGLDLKDGFNILKTMIREKVGKEVDVCISHPPYHDMVTYSGKVWGTEAVEGDLSRFRTIEEFYENMVKALINQRDAVKRGGWYGTIVGDLRRGGEYHSIQVFKNI